MAVLVLGTAVLAGLVSALAVAEARRRGARVLVLTVMVIAGGLGFGLAEVGGATTMPQLTVVTVVYVLTYVLSDVRWSSRPTRTDDAAPEPVAAGARGGVAQET